MRTFGIALALLSATVAAHQNPWSTGSSIQDLISNCKSNPIYFYPTDFTQGILPIRAHSHNDYQRSGIPFYSALSYGFVSIEADVWLYDGQLYVGHEPSALTKERTFDALYVQPILSVLKKQNPPSHFVKSPTKNGVYDTVPSQTLYLFVDIKTEGNSTVNAVIKALKPLRDAGYLTTFNGSMSNGPVTVIGTGSTPVDLVRSLNPRDYFLDGPLADLTDITSDIAPIASTDFAAQVGTVRSEALNDTQRSTLKGQIDAAHAKGIWTRYWNQPGWPIGTRNAVWRELWNLGSDLLNADDQAGVATFWEING